jgi:hypothetical protein
VAFAFAFLVVIPVGDLLLSLLLPVSRATPKIVISTEAVTVSS